MNFIGDSIWDSESESDSSDLTRAATVKQSLNGVASNLNDSTQVQTQVQKLSLVVSYQLEPQFYKKCLPSNNEK